MFIYFWDSGWGRRRDRERGGQRIWSRLCHWQQRAQCWAKPDAGPKFTNPEIMTWAKVRCSTDWATQAPLLTSHSFSDPIYCVGLRYPWRKYLQSGHSVQVKALPTQTLLDCYQRQYHCIMAWGTLIIVSLSVREDLTLGLTSLSGRRHVNVTHYLCTAHVLILSQDRVLQQNSPAYLAWKIHQE